MSEPPDLTQLERLLRASIRASQLPRIEADIALSSLLTEAGKVGALRKALHGFHEIAVAVHEHDLSDIEVLAALLEQDRLVTNNPTHNAPIYP